MILVTGGTGFLGAHLLYHLVEQGDRVRALKRKISSVSLTKKIFTYYTNEPEEMLARIEWVEGDLLDTDSLENALQDVSKVYHAAAMVSFHSSDRKLVWQNNVDGTRNLVIAALDSGIKKLCYVSSIGALGRDGSDSPLDENSFAGPSKGSSVYSKSKYEAEREVWRGMAEGLDTIVVNPSIIIGPGDWSKGSPQMFQTMWNGLKFYTQGINGFIDVNDVAKAMILLMDSDIKNERFILSSENVGYKQLFEWMADEMEIVRPKYKAGPLLSKMGTVALRAKAMVTGKKHTITRETARTANRQYLYSNKKLIETTGMKLTPVKESVIQTVKCFLNDYK